MHMHTLPRLQPHARTTTNVKNVSSSFIPYIGQNLSKPREVDQPTLFGLNPHDEGIIAFARLQSAQMVSQFACNTGDAELSEET